jgi:hypothetical protein
VDLGPLPRATQQPFLQGGGELARLIAEFDWAGTSVGPIEAWPQAMKTTIGLILRSPVPIVTLWGAKGVMIYNAAYAGFSGGRHPEILGTDVLKAWPEASDWNAHVMETVFRNGETLSVEDLELTLHRRGIGEPVWMNLDYSRVLFEDGSPAGVIASWSRPRRRSAPSGASAASESACTRCSIWRPASPHC